MATILDVDGTGYCVTVFTGEQDGREGVHVDMVSTADHPRDEPSNFMYHKHCCYSSDGGWEMLFKGTGDDGEKYSFWDVIESGEGGEWLELQMDAMAAIAKCVTHF